MSANLNIIALVDLSQLDKMRKDKEVEHG